MRSRRLVALATLALAASSCSSLPSQRSAVAVRQPYGQQAYPEPNAAQTSPWQTAGTRGERDNLAQAKQAYAQAPLTLPPPGMSLPTPTAPPDPPSSGPTGLLGKIFGRSTPAPASVQAAALPPLGAPATSAPTSLAAPMAGAPTSLAAATSAPGSIPAATSPSSQPTGFLGVVGGMFGSGRSANASASPPPAAAPTAALAHAPVIMTDAVPAAIAAPAEPPYTLDAGDRLRIVVFGQEGLSNSYVVDASGHISMPLIGSVPARGQTTLELARDVADRLRRGFIREPHVAIEVEIYRPFFILGEVTYPGQYPYVPNMTVETAVAIAGGFSPRAYRWEATVDRAAPGTLARARSAVPLLTRVRPGDTVIIKERWF
jgi:polysaccharide biosynthesis/export protein